MTLLSRPELENLFEIRAVLLGLAARQAAEHYEPAIRLSLQQPMAMLTQGRDDASAYARASAAMVPALAQLSHNEQLAELIAAFAQRIGRYTRLGLASRERCGRSLANWRALGAAIAARDATTAEAITRRLALEDRDAALVEIERRQCASRDAALARSVRVRAVRPAPTQVSGSTRCARRAHDKPPLAPVGPPGLDPSVYRPARSS